MPMQMGDVPGTWADTTLLEDLIKFAKTDFNEGIKFLSNGTKYYNV